MVVTNPSMPSSERSTAGPQDDEALDSADALAFGVCRGRCEPLPLLRQRADGRRGPERAL